MSALLGFLTPLLFLVLSSINAQAATSPPAVTALASGRAFTSGVPGCTNGAGGAFQYNWVTDNTSVVSGVYCGKGWSKGTNRTIYYAGNWTSQGYSQFGVYGWTRNPPIEYNVLEKWLVYVPDTFGATKVGTTTCNGNPYDILQTTNTDSLSIEGTPGYKRYWSVRTNGSGAYNGTVDMDCHFKAWAAAGLPLGTQDYQIATMVAYSSTGQSSWIID